MKIKQLRNLIKESISEVVKETLSVNIPKGANDTVKAQAIKNAKQKAGITDPTIPVDVVQNETKVIEMARIGKGYQLVDPNIDSSRYAAKKISGVSLDKIIDFFKENPGTEKKQIQNEFNFVRPQITNQLVNTFLEAGILEPVEGTGMAAPKIRKNGTIVEPEDEPERFDAEDYFIGTRMQDRGGLNFGDSTSIEDEEPEIPELPQDGPTSVAKISDEDYKVWMKYLDTKERLKNVKLALGKNTRTLKKDGDISTNNSNEDVKLAAKKKELENRMDVLISTSPYLQNKLTSGNKVNNEDPISIPRDGDIGELDEIIQNRFKSLANIK